jgi:tripartite-type tricarboxylate transporter receptor subunit TctC
MFTNPGTHVTVRYLNKNLMYDPIADFTPITSLAASWMCLLTHPSLPVSTVAELIDYAKRSPGKLSFSSNGIGTAGHLSVEQLKVMTGIEMVHVPYKGGAPALNAVVAGEVPVTVVSIAAGAQQHFKAGKVKMLAVMGPKRYSGLPNVPNMPELIPGYEPVPIWIGFIGPARMPKPVADRLRGAIADAVQQDKELRGKIEATGVTIVTNTPEEFLEALKSDIVSVGKTVKAAGIRPE